MMNQLLRFNHVRNDVSCGQPARRYHIALKSSWMSFLIACTLIFSLGVGQVLAQGQTVTGTVVGDDKAPLPGVTVQVKGTTRGTNTDSDGKFSIANVPSNATLVFSFIGLTTQEQAVGNRSVLNATLSSDNKALE